MYTKKLIFHLFISLKSVERYCFVWDVKFLRDLKGEFKKIVWPSKKQIINNTIIVIVAIIVIGCFIWALDFGLGALIKLFLA